MARPKISPRNKKKKVSTSTAVTPGVDNVAENMDDDQDDDSDDDDNPDDDDDDDTGEFLNKMIFPPRYKRTHFQKEKTNKKVVLLTACSSVISLEHHLKLKGGSRLEKQFHHHCEWTNLNVS